MNNADSYGYIMWWILTEFVACLQYGEFAEAFYIFLVDCPRTLQSLNNRSDNLCEQLQSM